MVESYVVYLEGHEERSPFKHFLSLDDAASWASSAVRDGKADLANVYRVESTYETRAAVAAVQMGSAIFLFARSPHRTQEEIDRDSQAAFDSASAEDALKLLGLL